MYDAVARADPAVHEALIGERDRQESKLILIASENLASRAVKEAASSDLTDKYAEGYPGRRYYGGCEFADVVEDLARDRATELFGADHVNVQPHAGSQANMAVYFSCMEPGDRILSMDLAHGGHLTHGHRISFSGTLFEVSSYRVDEETERIDYDAVRETAREVDPDIIVCGASAYPRTIDFEAFGEIARETGARLLADIAHIAGLVVAGEHPSPVPHADYVTTTTHKTLRGPRGGMIMCTEEHAKKVDRWVMPGIQGGPLVHLIAAKAVAFGEALTDDFAAYQRRIIENARALADGLAERGFRLVSGGTDNHLVLVDLRSKDVTGKDAEKALEEAGLVVNKNLIPFDPAPPLVASGMRLGTPTLTTRGMGPAKMDRVAGWIDRVITDIGSEDVRDEVRGEVRELCEAFPMPDRHV